MRDAMCSLEGEATTLPPPSELCNTCLCTDILYILTCIYSSWFDTAAIYILLIVRFLSFFFVPVTPDGVWGEGGGEGLLLCPN